MVPKTARNWTRERFSRYIQRPPAGGQGPWAWGKLQRSRGKEEVCHARYREATRGESRPALPSPPAPEPRPPSRDPLYANELSENHAFQRLRCRNARITSAPADGERLNCGTVFVEGARVA